MLHTKKGAALLQVIIVTAVLASMVMMVARANFARTTSARQTRRNVSAQMLIQACQAEVNTLWSLKNAEAFARDMAECWMTCSPGSTGCTTSNASRSYDCGSQTIDGVTYSIRATLEEPDEGETGPCQIKYELTDNQTGIREVVL
ncbi:MAG: hypothetical protein IKP96_03565 [Elusimicrobiaceae bacterium]|nr:hypothetical protein [Elusimicrobiaceae bacterium]